MQPGHIRLPKSKSKEAAASFFMQSIGINDHNY